MLFKFLEHFKYDRTISRGGHFNLICTVHIFLCPSQILELLCQAPEIGKFILFDNKMSELTEASHTFFELHETFIR